LYVEIAPKAKGVTTVQATRVLIPKRISLNLKPYGGVCLMQCFTSNECSEWLRQRAIVEAPYSANKPVHGHYFQFAPPTKPSQITAFTRGLVGELGEFTGALLVFTDWALYRPDEMALIDSLRRAHGERRWLIDAPGHLFASTEQAEAIGHSYLPLVFNWSAYLYLASGFATLYFWEGDLIDFWSPDEKLTQTVLQLVQRFELRVTSQPRSTPLKPT
jgi:hypothetical protein